MVVRSLHDHEQLASTVFEGVAIEMNKKCDDDGKDDDDDDDASYRHKMYTYNRMHSAGCPSLPALPLS
jgi:hypothetical protein